MQGIVGRIVNQLADYTIGSVIVLTHVALAERAGWRGRRGADPRAPGGARATDAPPGGAAG